MGQTHQECAKPGGIDAFIAIFKYNNLLKKIIKNIKYRLASDILEELILMRREQIIGKLSFFLKTASPSLLQAIPLHKMRQRQRGFNQAQEIVKKLQRLLSIPTCDFLIRVKNTFPQAQVTDRTERLNNVQGAFSISGDVTNKSFFLVDDVVTTGSTVSEAARTLKLHGAAKVYVFSLAKG